MNTSYEYLQLLGARIKDDDLVVIWGPKVCNEWHALRNSDGNLYDVYMSGAVPFALGMAVGLPHRRVFCLDGDGSLLMDLPVLPVLAHQNPSNLTVIVFDNEVYEAAGKIPTFTAGLTDLTKMAEGAGISNAWTARSTYEFEKVLDDALRSDGTGFITLKVEMSPHRFPPRAGDCIENKYRFIRHIERTENIRIIKPLGVSMK
jgi:sulfopyruvate decarboxylase subunit beta